MKEQFWKPARNGYVNENGYKVNNAMERKYHDTISGVARQVLWRKKKRKKESLEGRA